MDKLYILKKDVERIRKKGKIRYITSKKSGDFTLTKNQIEQINDKGEIKIRFLGKDCLLRMIGVKM